MNLMKEIVHRDGRILALERALGELEKDPHQFSTRPCATCRGVSVALFRPFGCSALAEAHAADKGK
jgi:hypothetical protein